MSIDKPLPHKVTVTVMIESPHVSAIEFGEGEMDPNVKDPEASAERMIRRAWGATKGRAHFTVWNQQSDPKNPTRVVSGTVDL